jgi:hemerythrin
MSLYNWDEKYSVGIKSIDLEHQGLFKLVNQLFEAMKHGQAKEIISETLKKLIAYTLTHFKREELFFSTTNYPDYLEHKKQHDLFIDRINEFKDQFEKGNQQVSIDLIKFLSDWLISHIMISDKKYTDYLIKFGIS